MADQGTEGLLSPFLRKVRLTAAKSYLNGRILDVGCGSGALAELVSVAFYMGVEIDELSLSCAMKNYPLHHFVNSLQKITAKFETVVSLAVIEHVPDPTAFLEKLSRFLVNSPTAKIVITTPHPSIDWVHNWGGKFGLFSKHATEEHKDLLDKDRLSAIGECAGLIMVDYRRFLFRLNQLVVFKKRLLKKDSQ